MSDPCEGGSCPFLHMNLPQCSERFTMEHLRDAFRYCVSDFQQCSHYVELTLFGEPADHALAHAV